MEHDLSDVYESNILAASWIDDIGPYQKEFEVRKMFYNSESILIEEDIRRHFDPKNDRKFYAQG
jgi:hypothetical protein